MAVLRSFSTACAFLASVVAVSGAPADDRIAAALDNISALVRPGEVGYATAWDGNRFVQCRRWKDGGMRCEAAGTRLQPSLKKDLTPERKVFLDTKGWQLDPAFGLFVKVFPADLTAAEIAADVRTTLIEGYGADAGRFEVETSWAPDVPCPPRVTASQSLAGRVDASREMERVTLPVCSLGPKTEPPPPPSADSPEALMRLYGPRLTAEVQRLRINSARRVWFVASTGIGYVQCAPDPGPAALYCEAQSAESWAALTSVLTAERVSWLHARGFADPGRGPNYWKTYPKELSDGEIARELVDLLFFVYGYRGTPALNVKAD